VAWAPGRRPSLAISIAGPASRPQGRILAGASKRRFLAGLIFIPDFELPLRPTDHVDDLHDLLRFGDCFAWLSPAGMAQLRDIVAAENGEALKPSGRLSRRFKKGDQVRIVDGPLAEFAARVERVDSKDRLKVFIETLRGMSVLVSDTLVELIQGSP
jgi:hypothetical protein